MRDSTQFLTLALHCIMLYDPLLKIEDDRIFAQKQGAQLELFSITTKHREEIAKFSKTLRYFLDVHREERSKAKSITFKFDFFERTKELEFCEYEFYSFWSSMINSLGEDKFEKQVSSLEQLAQGMPLKDYHPVIDFLSDVNMNALGRYNQNRCY